MKEKEYEKLLLKAETVFTSVIVIFFIAIIMLIALCIPGTAAFFIIFAVSLVLLIVSVLMALEIERTAGWYECGECGHKYIPERKAMLLTAHIGRTRHLRCPKCGKKSWNRKIISD